MCWTQARHASGSVHPAPTGLPAADQASSRLPVHLPDSQLSAHLPRVSSLGWGGNAQKSPSASWGIVEGVSCSAQPGGKTLSRKSVGPRWRVALQCTPLPGGNHGAACADFTPGTLWPVASCEDLGFHSRGSWRFGWGVCGVRLDGKSLKGPQDAAIGPALLPGLQAFSYTLGGEVAGPLWTTEPHTGLRRTLAGPGVPPPR